MIVVLTLQQTQSRKALSVQVSHSFAAASAVFDDDRLVSYAGLVPVMTLAEQTGLSALLAEKVHIAGSSRGGQPVSEAGDRGGRYVRGRGLYR
jgi:hypothetical protein